MGSGRGDHVYMMGLRPRPNGQRQLLRQYGPYALITVVIGVMFWWAQGVKRDLQQEHAALLRPVPPTRPVVARAMDEWTPPTTEDTAPGAAAPRADAEAPLPKKDWTHQIVVRPTRHDAPDDDTAASCPTPTGNWQHTCRRNILIEGPCSRKCLLTAVCLDVHNQLQNTTFEYPEGQPLEVKNINGLLCRTQPDGSVACGLNFHGNVARKNCPGYVPTRRETLAGCLAAPPLPAEAAPPRRAARSCEAPVFRPGFDFRACTDHSVGGTCAVKCAAGYVGLPTATCTADGWEVEGTCTQAPRDWTHKLSLKRHNLDEEPDDHNEKACPTPYGNWQHTCVEDMVVEGPCGGKCLVQARCKNLAGDLQDTTLEYREGERFEVRNVNGLLCRAEGDVPICGLNFHGNLALKNCARGNVPHRHEKLTGALPVLAAPAGGDRTGDRAKEDEAAKEEWRPRRRRSEEAEGEGAAPQRSRTTWRAAEDDQGAGRYQKQYAPVKWGRAEERDGTAAAGQGSRSRRSTMDEDR
eukprot:EG_transcript_6796